LLIVVVLTAFLNLSLLRSAVVLADETKYVEALQAYMAGRPLQEAAGYYYPTPLLASLGWMANACSIHTTLLGMRVLNLAGSCLGAFLVVLLGAPGLPPRQAVLMTFFFMGAVHVFQASIPCGNWGGISFGFLCLALVLPSSIGRSLALMASLSIKPYALAFALTRPWREAWAPLIFYGYLYGTVTNRNAFGNLSASSNAALVRALGDLGLPLPWQVLAAAALLVTLMAGRRRHWTASLLLGWFALPLSWDHTAMLLMPALALSARETFAQEQGPSRSLHLALLVLVFVVLQDTKVWGWPESDGPRWLSGLLGLLPSASAAYLLRDAWARTNALAPLQPLPPLPPLPPLHLRLHGSEGFGTELISSQGRVPTDSESSEGSSS
jgi:hypothetical protein